MITYVPRLFRTDRAVETTQKKNEILIFLENNLYFNQEDATFLQNFVESL
jgi:hypothetical protein